MGKLGSLAGGEELLYRLPEERRRREHVAYGRKASHDQSRVPTVRQGLAGRLGTASAEITGIQVGGIEEIQVEESAMSVAFAKLLYMDPTSAAGSDSIIRGRLSWADA